MSEVNNIEYVYLFNLDGTNRYKIGMTSNTPETRLTSVQYENKAFELKLVHYITVNDARKVEKLLHNFYAKNRVRFEYFDFDNITEVIEKMNSLQYIHDNTLLLSEIEKLKSELEQQKNKSLARDRVMLNLYKDTVKENLISNLAAAIVDNIQRYGDIKQLCTNILAFRDIDNDERKTIYKVVWSNYSNKPIEDFLQEHDLSYLLYAIGEEYKDVNYENYIKSMFLFFITRKEEFLYFINPNKIIDETIFFDCILNEFHAIKNYINNLYCGKIPIFDECYEEFCNFMKLDKDDSYYFENMKIFKKELFFSYDYKNAK